MKNITLIIALMACTATSAMTQADSTKTDTTDIAKTAELGEVTVNGVRVINKVDRQILIPTKNMVKAATDGYDLLKFMMIDGIKVNPVTNSISTINGGAVQVRINDRVASSQDITALRPDEVIRVEHIDNPGIRYHDENLGAVINYVVKQRYAGYAGGVSAWQALTTGLSTGSAYFDYNYKKSEFSISYTIDYRNYDATKRDDNITYLFPDGTERRKNYIGYDTEMSYTAHRVQLGYRLAEPGKYTFDARLFYYGENSPKSGNNQLIKETSQPDLYQYNKTISKDYMPSFDIYYSLNLPHNQRIMANVVGTYIRTDQKYLLRDYLFDQSPQQSVQAAPVSDYSYTADGRKYSLISEALYTKTMKKTSLSAGVHYTVNKTENDYTGNTNAETDIKYNNLYMFAQLQGNLGIIGYQAGMAVNRNSVHQGDIGYTKWNARPHLSLSTSAIKNIFIRYSGSIGMRAPSLSQLSEVRKYENELTASDGNTNLRPSSTYYNGLTVRWSLPRVRFNLSGYWFYAPDIIMASYIPEQQDGSYIIIGKPENQKSYTQQSVTASATIHVIKDKFDILMYGSYDRYKNRGLTYSNSCNSWRWGAEANLWLGNWTMSADFSSVPKSCFGERFCTGDRISNISVSYKYNNLRIRLAGSLVGYAQGYVYKYSTDSKYYKNNGFSQMKDNGNMISLTLSYNFSHGRKYKADQRSMSNSDNDSGIR